MVNRIMSTIKRGSKFDRQTAPAHANNFSLIRLILAVLVLVSHAFELADGDRSREILTRLFGTISFGELAVDGFFVISGYLVTKSFLTADFRTYFMRRIIRIYPGFIVCFVVSIALCQLFSKPAVGLPFDLIVLNAIDAVFLLPPAVPGGYPHSHYPIANASIWTLAYEFRCYLILPCLALLGVFRSRKAVLIFTVCLLAAYLVYPEQYTNAPAVDALGAAKGSDTVLLRLLRYVDWFGVELPFFDIKFFTIFLVGSCFFLFEELISYRGRYAVIATLLLLVCLVAQRLADPAAAIFGGYMIFWFAFRVPPLSLSLWLNKTDLSYGTYLYGWPVQKVLMVFFAAINPYALLAFSLIADLAAAFVSWKVVEGPCLRLNAQFKAPSPATII